MLYRVQSSWPSFADAYRSVVDLLPSLTHPDLVVGPILEWEGLDAPKFPNLWELLPPATPLDLCLQGDDLGQMWPSSDPPFWPLGEGEALAVFFGDYGSFDLWRQNMIGAPLQLHCDFANPLQRQSSSQTIPSQKTLAPKAREMLLQAVLEKISVEQAPNWSRQLLHQSSPAVTEGAWTFAVNVGGLGWSNDAVSWFPVEADDDALLELYRKGLETLPRQTGWRAQLRRSAETVSELVGAQATLQPHLLEVGSGRGSRFKNHQLQTRAPQQARENLQDRVLDASGLEALWQIEPELQCRLQLHWAVPSWVCGPGGEKHVLELETSADNSLELVRSRKGQVELYVSVEGQGVPRKAIKTALEGCLAAPLKAVL